MPIPKNKQELKEAIELTFSKLSADLSCFNQRNASISNLEGHVSGTYMSVNDLLAYLIGWTNLVLLWSEERDKRITSIFPAEGFKWNELGRLAQKFYSDHEELSFEKRLYQLNENVVFILKIIEKTPATELYGKPFYKEYTFGRMIQLNTSSPFKNARKRIRKTEVFKFLKTNQ